MNGFPKMEVRPRVAYHAPLKVVKLKNAVGKISKEMIMIYPPGIPWNPSYYSWRSFYSRCY